MATYFGIDLGTTYSAISFIDERGGVQVVGPEGGLVPSVVYFGSNGVIVGKIAKDKGKGSGEEAQRVVSFVKREIPTVNPKVDPDRRDYFQQPYEFDGKKYTPTDVSAEILKKLKEDVERLHQATIEKVVITVPAFFKDDARQRTLAAGVKGLGLTEENIKLLDEPQAAALNYALDTGESIKGKTFLVYDLGGGTFDITVMSVIDDPNNADKILYDVVCTEGNHYLGGVDWDNKIIEFFKEEFRRKTGVEISEANAVDRGEFDNFEYDLRLDAEKRKQDLSEPANNSVSQQIRFHTPEKRVDESVELTRTKFDELTKELLDDTFRLTNVVIEEAKSKGVSRIDAFLMVGGSTFMLQVREGLIRRYANEPILQGITPIFHEPNKAVTKGAAKCAQVWAVGGAIERILKPGQKLTQKDYEKVATTLGISVTAVEEASKISLGGGVCPESYGIKYLIGRDPNSERDEDFIIVNLVQKGSKRPTNGESVGNPTWDGQTSVSLEVWSNDVKGGEAQVAISKIKGYLDFDFIRPMNRNEACIKSELKVDAQGMLHLFGTDTRGGETHDIRIDPNNPVVKKK